MVKHPLFPLPSYHRRYGYLRFESLHPGTVLRISWTRSFEQCVNSYVVRAGAFQCSPVMVGDTCEFENVIQCPNTTPPPASDDYSFWEHRCGIQGTGSVSGWVGVCGRQIGCEGDCASTVRGSALLLLKPSISSWPRGTPSSTGPCGLR